MPYIPEADKSRLDPDFGTDRSEPITVGELTYLVTKVCVDYAEQRGESFATFGQVIAALECSKLEFYRRALAPYEDIKCGENGDVYQ